MTCVRTGNTLPYPDSGNRRPGSPGRNGSGRPATAAASERSPDVLFERAVVNAGQSVLVQLDGQRLREAQFVLWHQCISPGHIVEPQPRERLVQVGQVEGSGLLQQGREGLY